MAVSGNSKGSREGDAGRVGAVCGLSGLVHRGEKFDFYYLIVSLLCMKCVSFSRAGTIAQQRSA